MTKPNNKKNQRQQPASVKKTEKALITESRNTEFLYVFIVFCVPILLYLQSVSFGFINFDDDSIITDKISFLSDLHNAPRVFLTDAFSDGSSHFYRPLQTLSYMIDMQFSGESATWMYHLTNIILLGLIACTLFLLLRKFAVQPKPAMLATLIYCAHPLFISNIAWVPARGDLQLMFFTLLSFLLLIRFLHTNKLTCLLLHWVTFTLALFSKETAALLPLLFIMYYLAFSKEKRFEKKHLLLVLLYAVSGIFWLWLREKAIGDFSNRTEMLGVLTKNGEVGFIPFIQNLQTIPESLANFFLPFKIDQLPNFSVVRSLVGLGIMLMITFLFIRNKEKPVKEKLFFLAWFFLLLLPTMLFKPSFIDYLHHRFFLPMVGMMLFVLFIIPSGWLSQKSAASYWIMLVLFFILAATTFVKSRSYADPLTFYNSAIEQNPNSDFAFIHRGYLYNDQGRYDKALDDFSRAIDINPKYAEAYNNRGNIYSRQGSYEKAIDDYTRAIELKPGIAEAYNNRGLAYGYIGLYEKAIADYTKVIEINPGIAEAYNNLGMAYGNQGIYDKAISGFSKAIELKPDYGQAYNNRGIAYCRKGLYDTACPDFKKAEELGFEGAKENIIKFCN